MENMKSIALQLSIKKSGFLAFHVAVKKELEACIKTTWKWSDVEFPPVCTALKDLGVEATLSRVRRVGVWRGRVRKGLQRASRLNAIPRGKRKQLVRGNVMPTATWGHQAAGMAKSMLRDFRVELAKRALFRKNLVVYRLLTGFSWTKKRIPDSCCRCSKLSLG